MERESVVKRVCERAERSVGSSVGEMDALMASTKAGSTVASTEREKAGSMGCSEAAMTVGKMEDPSACFLAASLVDWTGNALAGKKDATLVLLSVDP